MSEPVTHAEIEDVLSSIRRLVSEDSRSDGLASFVRPTPTPVARLILTPALRVSQEPLEEAQDDAQDQQPLTESAGSVADIPADNNDAVFVADAESDGGDLGPDIMRMTELQSDTQDPTPDVAPEMATPDETDTEIDYKQPFEPALESIDLPEVTDAPEALAEAVDTTAPEADVDTDQDAVSEEAPWNDPASTLFAAAGVAADQAVGGESDDTSTASFADKIAALEAAIGQTSDQWEPDGDSEDAYAGTNVETIAWEDHQDGDQGDQDDSSEAMPSAASAGEDDVTEAPQPDGAADDPLEEEPLDAVQLAEQAITDEALGTLAGDDALMDEDSLRELVADIVREELQGALGERITRNVRKLVRREIQRALAVQDLT